MARNSQVYPVIFNAILEVIGLPVVLGIHACGHEAGACIVTPDGLWAISEERLSRIKYDSEFPSRSIAWALKASGIEQISKVDLVVYDLLEQAGQQVLESLANTGYSGNVCACRHHAAHAASAFFPSPFNEAAVLTIDAGGSREGESGPGLPPSPPAETHPLNREVQAKFLGQAASLSTLSRTVVEPPYTINPGVLYGLTAEFLGFGNNIWP